MSSIATVYDSNTANRLCSHILNMLPVAQNLRRPRRLWVQFLILFIVFLLLAETFSHKHESSLFNVVVVLTSKPFSPGESPPTYICLEWNQFFFHHVAEAAQLEQNIICFL